MSIIKAYAFPHPPLAVPAVGCGNENKIQKTLNAFVKASLEISQLAPDTIIFITPHNVVYADYFHISPGGNAKGNFSRFNASDVSFKTEYDVELAEKIASIAYYDDIPAGSLGEKDANLDHGVIVPMWFINQHYQDYKTIRISQSGMDPSEHYRFGQCIAKAAEQTNRKAVLVASGDLSHKLPGSSYGTVTEGSMFDKMIIEAFESADFLSMFNISDDLRERAAECGYNSFMALAGCLDCRKVNSKLYSYEGPFGVGYAVAGFLPGKLDESRKFLEQYTENTLETLRECRKSEDHYRSLARQSLEYTVKNGGTLPLPDCLPDELLNNRTGVFVSLHKNGHLRGCVGTIAPTAGNIALEIIQNAVSAGLSDNRFEPVAASELPFLTYKVDVLSAAEVISGLEELDVKRYGVIVSSGYKRGLLLPNLDGIDTVEEQVSIAKRKGGISENEPVKLERFEVIRYE